MLIKDILFESSSDVVARFYKDASKTADDRCNPEVAKYHEKNSKYYDDHFKKWFAEDIVPVFTKPTDTPQPVYDTIPSGSKLQSPGFRGLQYALAGAGLPYNRSVQAYKPDPNRALASQTMDGARNPGSQ